MHCASAFSCSTTVSDIADELLDQVRLSGPGDSPDLALLFVSPHLEDEFGHIATEMADRLDCQSWLGCAAAGLVATNRDFVGRPAAVLWTVSLGGGQVRPFCVSAALAEEVSTVESLDFQKILQAAADESDLLLVLADGFSVSMDRLLERFDSAYPGSGIVGG